MRVLAAVSSVGCLEAEIEGVLSDRGIVTGSPLSVTAFMVVGTMP